MNEKYLEAGKIISTHGIKGEVKVLPWADSPEFLTRFKTFYLVGAVIGRPQTGEPLDGGTDCRGQFANWPRNDKKGDLSASGGRPMTAPTGGCKPEGPASGGRSMSAPTALNVEQSRVQKTCVLIKFKGIDTVEDAQKLREKVLSIARDDPRIPAGTIFQADLIGMPVRAGGKEIGKIAEILSMPSSDVWVVRGEKEYLIPNVKAFVPAIELSLGYVDVNLIEGMETDAD